MDATTTGGHPPSKKKRSTRHRTTIYALSHDILSTLFSFLDLLDLVRCSAVCKSWKLAMDCHRFSMQEGPINVFQWKGHSVGKRKRKASTVVDSPQAKILLDGGVDQCRMKTGLILTGVGDKVMRLWSAENYKCLDEFSLPDRAPLVDFDFDESKKRCLLLVWLGLVYAYGGEMGKEIYFPHVKAYLQGVYVCGGYVDPEAVVGCEDGTVRLFDMYSRKSSQIINEYFISGFKLLKKPIEVKQIWMHAGPVTCLGLSDDQLIVCGSSLGSVSLSDLSSDQRVAALRSTNSGALTEQERVSYLMTGVRTLCFNPSSHLIFAGSTAGYVSCWDLRTMRTLWNTRVSPNVIYSMHHLRSDKSTLVVGGIDGVLRFLDQDSGEVFSRCIMNESSSSISNSSRDSYGVIRVKKARRLSEDTRIDLIPKTSRPSVRCLAVGMQKVVTTHNEKFIRVWKFNR
ncbi:unnamed protein product [Camellia sinensis]